MKLSVGFPVVLWCSALLFPIFAQYEITWDNPNTHTHDTTRLTVKVKGYSTSSMDIDGKEYISLHLAQGGIFAPRGYPDLPSINKAVIIPDDQRMEVEVLDISYTDIPVNGIAPSRGAITKNQDPRFLPFAFDQIYERDAWYPAAIAELGSPFIQRDFRGCLVQVHPFQYNPVKKLLRAYSKISLQVRSAGTGNTSVLNRPFNRLEIDAEFNSLYQNRFLNYESTIAPICTEDGSMLIISHADFIDVLSPFVEWKKKKGVKVELVDVAEAGTNAATLAAYIANYYNNAANNLKYVLLVGDYDKVPTPLVQSQFGADIKYGEIKGNDCYSELLIGRFSGTTAAQIKTQTEKTIYYETKLNSSDTWLSNVLQSASSDPYKNIWGESDADFINNDNKVLTSAGYTNIFRHNQNGVGGTGCVSGTAESVTGVINTGIAFWEYSDGGTKISYQAVCFTTSNALALNNPNRLFFTFAVACNSGEFNTSAPDCLGEALMKAEKNGKPIGAIGCYMGSILQPWDPPYAAVREVVANIADKYPANKKHTLGGLMISGGMKAYEACPDSDGRDVCESFILFGDPNLQVYTKTPKNISIIHPANVPPTATSIVITGTDSATVCLYSKKLGIQQVATIAGGLASFPVAINGKDGDTIYITGTRFNYSTYEGFMIVGANAVDPSGTGVYPSCFSARIFHSTLYYQIPGNNISVRRYHIRLRLHNPQGKLVFSLALVPRAPGNHSVNLNKKGNPLPPGLYFCTIMIGDFTKTIMMSIK